MATDYWERYWLERRSRRRFLGGAVVTGAGVAGLALAGCGDDDDGETPAAGTPSGTAAGTQAASATQASNATPTPSDPYAGATRGGTYRQDQSGDPPTIDPYGNIAFLTKGFAAHIYSRLFKYNAGAGVKRSDLLPVGDLAEASEASPDGLTWTIKLRKDAKFHNVAPVNGRPLTTEDVKFSWGRAIAEANPNRTQLAFVDRVEYPDTSTVKFTLKAPNAAFLDVLADANLLWIMPTESDGKFNPAQQAIGSGPWMLDSYQSNVAIRYKKNPEWFVKGFPLMDAVESAIIPEYATRLAQFQAGNTDVSAITAEDVIAVKKGMPNINVYGEVSQLANFLYFDPDPASPWAKDPRIKQAVSMAIDRDAVLDLGYNVRKLKAEGLAVSERWNNFIPAGMERFWLDPRSAAQGDSKKYFEYNVKEAKALLAAAGFANGLETIYQYTANRYGATFNTLAEAHISFLNEIGIKTTTDVQDYASKYITQTFAGNFKGIAYGLQTPFPEAGGYPLRMFTENPSNTSRIADPELTELALKQQSELDPAKRKELFFEIQRKNAAKMHYVPSNVGAGTGWAGYQGWVKNIDIQTVPGSYGAGTETTPFRWLQR